jgi:hypothetical protein
MTKTLRKLREYTATAFVGGSDLVKISEQLALEGQNGEPLICTIADNYQLSMTLTMRLPRTA